MARILICHVPKDGSVARDLGAALMGRGHYVSFDGEPDTPRPDRLSRLRQFEAVIVLWTEHSWQNAGLSDIAREMLPLNLLVPVRSEHLPTTRLPLMFRKLNILIPRDVDGIARVVARLSTAASSLRDMNERETARRAAEAKQPDDARSGSRPLPAPLKPSPKPASGYKPASAEKPAVVEEGAVRARPLFGLPEVEAVDGGIPGGRREPSFDGPPPRSASVSSPRGAAESAPRSTGQIRRSGQIITAEDLARAVDAGLLVPHIPEAMWLGAPTTVELILGREILAELVQPELGYGSSFAVNDRQQSIETISVSLYGSSEAFEIERQSERTQFVSTKQTPTPRDPATFGRWAWLVTPRTSGDQDLILRVSALLRDRNGVPAPVALPDCRFSVDIQVPEGQGLISALAGWVRR